ncbi:hypothetical protein K2173_015377 [Erythroxylum novogranatense]|uniref:Integrase catalytic domain-containing protein n=1 Tax=Erythroxylum novogranatense TaxID=1862640 RepID=A0AAV8SS62_9ROSI|nr:hypothetical protein K2173_015377 [Erythroxylum novogranatense]
MQAYRRTETVGQRTSTEVGSSDAARRASIPGRPRGQAPARVFTMTWEDAEAAPDVVTGTVKLFSDDMIALIDPGSTHSFVSSSRPVCSRNVSPLDTPLMVSTPIDHYIIISQVYRSCEICIGGELLVVDLMPLKMGGLDVILGMDTLEKYNAHLDCKQKTVEFELDNGKRVVFSGDRKANPPRIVSSLIVEKMMRKGCEAFLAYMVDTRADKGKLEDIPVVREFSDVFPEELPGLPPPKEIEFPIELLSEQGVHVDPKKIEAVVNWEASKNVAEVRSFLGFAGYYRRFVEGFSMIAAPMTKLLRKNKKFIWSDECQKSFEELKHRLTSAPILRLSSGDEGYTVYSDASRKGLGCVLMQGDRTRIFTDHKSLKYLLSQKELNLRQRRWIELLKDYDLLIEYHPGKTNVVADALSRKSSIAHVRTVYLPLLEEMAKLKISLKQEDSDCLLDNFRVRPILREKVIELQIQDAELSRLRDEIQNGKNSEVIVSDDGLMTVENRLCIPDVQEVKTDIMDEAHNAPYAMHPGSTRMVTMDFLMGLPRNSRKHDAIWVIVDRLTKSAHFLAIKQTDSLHVLAKKYIDEIVRLHGIPDSIVSDRDPRFTSRFWGSLQEALGTKLHFSTAFHPQTDGQSERTIRTLEGMLRACVIDFRGA